MSNSNDSKEPLYHQQLKESLDDSSKQTTVAAPEAPSLPYCHQQLKRSHDTQVPSSSSHAPSDHHPIREHQQSTGGWNPHGPPYYTSDPPHQFDQHASLSSAGNNAGVLSAGTYHSHNDIRSQQSHPPHGMGSKFHQHNMAPPPPRRSPPWDVSMHFNQTYHQTPGHQYTEPYYPYMYPFGQHHQMQPRVPSYSHDPSSSFSARDPYAEDINNMTPKQLDYARHNVHLAQAPSAASACKQGPYKMPSDGVASAMCRPSMEQNMAYPNSEPEGPTPNSKLSLQWQN